MKLLLDTLTDDQTKQFSKLSDNEREFVALTGAVHLKLDKSKTLGSEFPMELGLRLLEAMKETGIINNLV
jgi:hypothetical protein